MRRIKRIIFYVLMAFWFCIPLSTAYASEWSELYSKNVKEYGYDDGLVNNIGNALAQTDDGYLWIGQYAGLTQYNGKKFTTYSSVGDVDLNGILTLLATGNTLYIGTQKHFIKYENGTFEIIDLGSIITVNSIAEYNDIIYVATSKGLFSYEQDGKVELLSSLGSIDVAASKNGIYFVTSDNLVRSVNSGSIFYNERSIKSIYIKDNKIFLGSKKGQMIIYSNNKFKEYDTGSDSSINTFTYANGILFIGADDGTYTFDGNQIEKFKRMNVSNSIEAVLVDYQDNIWIASSANGIVKISSNAFADLFIQYEIEDYLYSKLRIYTTGVNAIERYKGILYVATENCLIGIDEAQNTIVENALTEDLMDVRIRDLEIYQDKLYVATYTSTKDMVVFDGNTISYTTSESFTTDGYPNDKAGEIRCFAKDDTSLYVGTNYGISKITGTEIKNIKPESRPLYLYCHGDYLYACIQDNGIYKYDKDLNLIEIVKGSENSTVLKCLIHEDLYVYNVGGSLYVTKPDGTVQKVNIPITGSIVEIIFINGKYYIGTDSDIYVIDEKQLLEPDISYKILSRSEGLKSGLNSNASGMYDENRSIYYFAARDSVYTYNLNYNTSMTKPTKIALSGVTADAEEYSVYDKVILPASTNRVTFHFDVLSYMDYANFNVYYKLDGVDHDVNVISYESNSSVTYTNLKGGEYTLHIWAMDSDGNITENQVQLQISKELSVIEHPWFITLLVILGLCVMTGLVLLAVYVTKRHSMKRQKELQAITLEAIQTVAHTIDAKDTYTNGHSTRVGQYSKIIAEALGMSEKDALDVYYIGLLHDIGKIAIPRTILNKPGRLTDEEFGKMKSHTIEGAKILSSISTIPHIGEGARSHHERYDGSGYPDGLKGENIPYIARIICCADCYDAMATKRSYKEPYTKEKIISEFERCSGSQFDPKIAKVVIDLIQKDILIAADTENTEFAQD